MKEIAVFANFAHQSLRVMEKMLEIGSGALGRATRDKLGPLEGLRVRALIVVMRYMRQMMKNSMERYQQAGNAEAASRAEKRLVHLEELFLDTFDVLDFHCLRGRLKEKDTEK